jgi:magnesium chelatase subunit D
VEDQGAELHPLIAGRLAVLIDAAPEDSILIQVKALCYLEEFGSNPELFNTKLLAGKEAAVSSVTGGQRLIQDVQISDAQLDLIARMCADFNVEGNSNEFRIESVAKGLCALRGERKVADEDIVRAAQMVIPLTVSADRGTREELAESIRNMVLQYA